MRSEFSGSAAQLAINVDLLHAAGVASVMTQSRHAADCAQLSDL
ncbi:MAG: hypothetical protein V9F03_08360 [Microthrixaceae bacterium]